MITIYEKWYFKQIFYNPRFIFKEYRKQ
jgi:hypothetical protein